MDVAQPKESHTYNYLILANDKIQNGNMNIIRLCTQWNLKKTYNNLNT